MTGVVNVLSLPLAGGWGGGWGWVSGIREESSRSLAQT